MSEPADSPFFRALAAVWERVSFFNRLGASGRQSALMFGSKRDIYDALGYPDTITLQNYRGMFERCGIAGRLVRVFPKAVWRGGAEIIEDDNPDTLTPFESAWQELNHRLRIWSIFQRAHILAKLGRYSVILLGAPGELQTELTRCTADDVKFLDCFSEEDATIQTVETNRLDPRFGRPEFYMLKRVAALTANASVTQNLGRCHYSRVFHVVDGALDSQIFARPYLEDIWNDLLDMLKVGGGGAEAFWKRADPGTKVKFDPLMPIDPDPAKEAAKMEAVRTSVEDFTHQLKRVIGIRGADVEHMEASVADFSKPSDAVLQRMCAAKGVPMRILMGSERGELASTQDRDNFGDQVKDIRDEFAAPQLARPFIERLIELGVLPSPSLPWIVKWPDTKELTMEQKIGLALKTADVNQKMGHTIITDDEMRADYFDKTPLVPSEIEPLVQPVRETVTASSLPSGAV